MGIPLTPDLSGKIAIVTGASRGIGLAIAQAFLQAGASVCLTALASWITGADLVVDGGALVQAAWMNRPQAAGGSPQIIQGLAGGTAAAPAKS